MSESAIKLHVKVLYFAGLTDYTSAKEEKLEIPQSLPIQDFIAHLIKMQPKLASASARELLDACACAVNLEYMDLQEDEYCLRDGDTIALIPPVSGG